MDLGQEFLSVVECLGTDVLPTQVNLGTGADLDVGFATNTIHSWFMPTIVQSASIFVLVRTSGLPGSGSAWADGASQRIQSGKPSERYMSE